MEARTNTNEGVPAKQNHNEQSEEMGWHFIHKQGEMLSWAPHLRRRLHVFQPTLRHVTTSPP
jgi:hypothetical protein